MIARRGFLASAGIAFCSCGLLDAARAQGAAGTRVPVSVAGRRVRTVDAHARCYFQEALDLMGPADAAAALPQTKGVPEHFLEARAGVEGRLQAMDDMGIDMEVLSINPFWYGKEPRRRRASSASATTGLAYAGRIGAAARRPSSPPPQQQQAGR